MKYNVCGAQSLEWLVGQELCDQILEFLREKASWFVSGMCPPEPVDIVAGKKFEMRIVKGGLYEGSAPRVEHE